MTPQRLANLLRGTEERTKRAFWFAALDDVKKGGVLGQIWGRSGNSERAGFLD